MRVTCLPACVCAQNDLTETSGALEIGSSADQHNYLCVDTHVKTTTVPEEKQNNAEWQRKLELDELLNISDITKTHLSHHTATDEEVNNWEQSSNCRFGPKMGIKFLWRVLVHTHMLWSVARW